MRNIDFQVAQFLEYFEAAIRTEISLHRVIQPVIGKPLFLGDRQRGMAQFRGRNQESVDVFGRGARLKYETHDRAAREVQFTPHAPSGEFIVQRCKQFPDALNGEHQTRAPMLESMKMFRLRKGTGDSRSRCALRLSHGTANTGSERGAISEVQVGGQTPWRCAACSTIAAR